MNKISKKAWQFYTRFFLSSSFMRIGKRSVIIKPLQIDSAKSIEIEDNVSVYHFAWLMGNNQAGKKTLTIQSGTTVGHFAHIIALNSMTIEKNVLIADKVFISDCTHSYEDITKPVIRQDVKDISPVVIGEGSWIGENVCICGASIGKHCVIGANSVVTSDIPDYCVAVGSPARVVKKFDHNSNEWKKVSE